MSEESRETKKRTGRSPGYPSINLESAIEKAMIIKEKENGGRYFSPYQSIITHWGYSPKSSPGLLMLSSLLKYGLIEAKGTGDKRQIKLADLALKILFCQENNQMESNEYFETLSHAALNPAIFKELWNKYEGKIPSDITLKRYLLFDRNPTFKDDAASECIKHFKSTILFANLDKSDNMSGHENNKIKEGGEEMNFMAGNQGQKHEQDGGKIFQLSEIPLLFPDGKKGSIKIPYPLTKKEWKLFENILEAYKPSLMKDEPTNSEKEKSEDTQH